jgi:hypothetical protein
MRKTLLGLVLGLGLFSCTENARVKSFGGDGDINLPKGQKLVNITWKESQIWYLTRPFKKDEDAEIYRFQEESGWGVVEGTYYIHETKY